MKLLFIFLSCFFVSTLGAQKLVMTVGYCPSLTSGMGATVEVDVETGNFTVVGHFKWPSGISAGCVIENDPSYVFDGKQTVYFDFLADFGLFVGVDVAKGDITSVRASTDPFFVGFNEQTFNPAGLVEGLQGTATENGWCSDGCFELGTLNLKDGAYHNITNVPWRAVMDDTSWIDTSTNTYYFQASYPLNHVVCGPHDYSLCLVAFDSNNGNMLSHKHTEWTAYKLSPNGQDATNVFGFVQSDANGSYQFGTIDMTSATFTPVSNLSSSVVVQMDPWVSSISSDHSLFAQASGNTAGQPAELLVIDTSTGEPKVKTTLKDLGEKLGAALDLFDVWAITFVDE